jgi:hypothetical protein
MIDSGFNQDGFGVVLPINSILLKIQPPDLVEGWDVAVRKKTVSQII